LAGIVEYLSHAPLACCIEEEFSESKESIVNKRVDAKVEEGGVIATIEFVNEAHTKIEDTQTEDSYND
jgi:hypothetical protein